MQRLFNMLKPEWWRFEWRYWRKQTPWDTQVTPPEVMEFLEQAAPGCALDLGCGTGTNAITLAQRHWQVTAIDFSSKAIRTARRKSKAAGMSIDFFVADVSNLDFLEGPFDFALDIGCLFTLNHHAQHGYVQHLSKLLSPGACYMLYAWLPRPWGDTTRGMTPEEVSDLLEPAFSQDEIRLGEDQGAPSAWYWFTRK